jgi:hypothetical protein
MRHEANPIAGLEEGRGDPLWIERSHVDRATDEVPSAG